MTIALIAGMFILGLILGPLVWVCVNVLIMYATYLWLQRGFRKGLKARQWEAHELASRGVVYYRDEKFVARHIAAQRLMKKQKS